MDLEHITTDDVLEICSVMETGGADPDAIEEATKLFYAFTRSTRAWEVCMEMLVRNASPDSTQLAAKTMQSKIERDYLELPPESRGELREALMTQLLAHAGHSRVTLQLTLALADFGVYCENWEDPVGDISSALLAPDDGALLVPLLQFLRVWPEEVQSKRVRVSEIRRATLRAALEKHASQVLPLLEQCLAVVSGSEEHMKELFTCLTSWMYEVGHNGDNLSAHSFLRSPLLVAAVESLTSEELSEGAADVVCQLLRMAVNETRSDAAARRAILEPIREHMMLLSDLAARTVGEGNTELGQPLCRVLCDLACAEADNLETMVQPHAVALLELCLQFTLHENPQVRGITFEVWEDVAESVYSQRRPYPDRFDEAIAFFQPLYTQLFRNFAAMSTVPEDHEGEMLTNDDITQEYRDRLKDTVNDTVFMIGAREATAMLLETCVSADDWRVAEGALSLMSIIAESWSVSKKEVQGSSPEDSEVVQAAFEWLLSLPEDAPELLRGGACVYMGRLSYWISLNPQALEPVMAFILVNLQRHLASAVTTITLKRVARSCGADMAPHIGVLMDVVRNREALGLINLDATATAAAGGSSPFKPLDDYRDVLAACGRVLAHLPPEALTEGLGGLCAPEIETIAAACAQTPPAEARVPLLTVGHLFKFCNPPPDRFYPDGTHPCWPVAESVWPVLHGALDAYTESENPLEDVMSSIKWIVRCLGSASAPLAPDLLAAITRIFETHHRSGCLYLAAMLIETFGRDEDSVENIITMVAHLTEEAFTLLTASETAIRDNPTIVEDYFRMICMLIKQRPLVFLRSDFARLSFECGLASVTLDDRHAHHEVVRYFLTILYLDRKFDREEDNEHQAELQTHATELFTAGGAELCAQLAKCVCGEIRSYLMPDVVRLLWELCLRDLPVDAWMAAAPCFQPDQLMARVAPHELSEFVQAFTRHERQTEATIAEAVNIFTQLFRE